MLVCDAVRGDDSTGIFGVNNSGNVTYIKLASHPFNLLKTSEYLAWKQDSWQNGKMLVGHNRKASSGAVSNENAHPFTFGPICLVHNGLVDNFRSLVHHKERTKHNVDVDSHAIALLFARNDPVDVIPEIRGAFVFVWYNASTKKLNFVRNTERPLSLVEASDGVYFASEKGMLRWLLRRRSNTTEISEFKPGVLLSLDMDGVWESTPVKVFEKPPIVVTPPYSGGRHNDPLVVDSDGTIHLPVQPPQSRHVPKLIEMKLEDSFNIHYGDDKLVSLEDRVLWPQIVFSVDDFKRVSDEHVSPPVWKLWGKALDSEQIEVSCQFRGEEHECEELGYATYIKAHVSRVADKIVNKQLGQIVYCLYPTKCEILTHSSGLPFTTDHLTYMHSRAKCTCGHVELKTIDAEDKMFIRSNFTTTGTCQWCLVDTPECARLCKAPGKCSYCVDAVANKKADETTENIAVQTGK